MTAWFAWAWLAMQIVGSAPTDASATAEPPALIALCAHRLGKTNAEITLVAALDSHGVMALDGVAAPLPALLRRAARQTWFSVTPSGSEATSPGAALLKHARIDADGDAQHLRLGPCTQPGTVYATRRIAAARLPAPSVQALQPTSATTGLDRCLEQAWDHGAGRIEVLGRTVTPRTFGSATAAICRGKPAKWVMLDPNSPPPKQGLAGVTATYAEATDAIEAPIRVNHVKVDGRLLTWVLKQDNVSVGCAIIDGSRAPAIDELWVEIEDLGC